MKKKPILTPEQIQILLELGIFKRNTTNVELEFKNPYKQMKKCACTRYQFILN